MASIEDLPASVLHCILLLLSLRDAARTMTLSSKWRNLWTELQTYELNGDHQRDMFAAVGDRVVFSASSPGIKNFSLSHSNFVDSEQRVQGWLDRLASGHPLEKLDVDIGVLVQPPASLFRCATLVDLRLVMHAVAGDLGLSGGFAISLPLLKWLRLENLVFRKSAHFQQLIDGCPALETMALKNTVLTTGDDPAGGVHLRGAALRRVALQCCHGYGTVPFEVSAPGMDEFIFSGRNLTFIDRRITRLSATTVHMILADGVATYRAYNEQYGVPYASLGNGVSAIMSAFHGVAELVLSGWCLEYLSRVVDTISLPVWGLDVLTISGMWPNRGHAGVVLYVVHRSPCLRVLNVANELNHPVEISLEAQRQNEHYPVAPDSFFDGASNRHRRLRRFSMTNYTGNVNQIGVIRCVRAAAVNINRFRVTDAFGHDWSGSSIFL